MRTACAACAKEFASPEAAQRHHIRSHAPVRRAPGGTINGRFVKKWPEDAPFVYRQGQRWSEYTDLTPQATLNEGVKTGADSSVSSGAIAGHVGLDWSLTPCPCNCHFDKPECNEKACA